MVIYKIINKKITTSKWFIFFYIYIKKMRINIEEGKDKDGNDYEIIIYNSDNIKKTIYYPSKKSLFLFFIKERKNNFLKESQLPKDELWKNDKKVFKGTLYKIRNIDEVIYKDFKNADSQGRYYNAYIAKEPKYFKDGNFILTKVEIKEVLEEQLKYIKK